jgi:isopenicillin N synthase-like dioxygenase
MASDPDAKPALLKQLHAALFDVGFLYVINHNVPADTISRLANMLPDLFGLPVEQKAHLSKLNSPHFLGYSGFAEETTLGKQDLREQFDFATELPAIWENGTSPDATSELRPCNRNGSIYPKRLHSAVLEAQRTKPVARRGMSTNLPTGAGRVP